MSDDLDSISGSLEDDEDELRDILLESSSSPPLEESSQVVLKKRGHENCEELPEGWIEVIHASGIPIYIHKGLKVCGPARPYYLGGLSARHHDTPISSIPCFHYKRELEKENQTHEQSTSSKEHQKRDRWLNPEELKEYYGRLFEFVDIKVRKFKTWADRRKHNLMLKHARSRPSLSTESTQASGSSSRDGSTERTTAGYPESRSSVCILHEFVQHKEKVQPRYLYKELENATLPYSATAEINNTPYGTGFGKSKKEAKEEAARLTAEILIPGFKNLIELQQDKRKDDSSNDLEFFDRIKIEDVRIPDLCLQAGLQSPYQILVEYLKRNTGDNNPEIRHSGKLVEHDKTIYTMIAGDYEAEVECKNKREGKQKASQKILQMMHPRVTSWGGLLLMYGRNSSKAPREKKDEEQQNLETQIAAGPNESLLKNLKEAMIKLQERTEGPRNPLYMSTAY